MLFRAYKIYNRSVHSYLLVLEIEATGSENPYVFVVKDRITEDPSSSSAQDSSSEESHGSSSVESEESLYEIVPNRELVSVASLTDLMVLPLHALPGELYRASTVALLFRSKAHMEVVLKEITLEVTLNAELQNEPISFNEVVELRDPGHGLDEDAVYPFP